MKKILLFLCLTISLAAEMRVIAFAGSTRKDSYNKQLIMDAAQIAEQMGAKVTIIDLKDFPMPYYDADLEESQGMPENAKRLRDLIIKSNAIIIATPEYNHSIPAVLKNVLDWASRNEAGNPSKEAFKDKWVAIMSASPGKKGGRQALVHLQDIVEDVGGTVVSTKVSIPNAHNYFANKNKPLNPQLKIEVEELLSAR